jgi:hypothetical protein
MDPTTDPTLPTKYVFAVLCLITSAAGVVGQLYASRLAANAVLGERPPDNYGSTAESIHR